MTTKIEDTPRGRRAADIRDDLLADLGSTPTARQVGLASRAGALAAALKPDDIAAKTALVAVLQALMQTRSDLGGDHAPSPE